MDLDVLLPIHRIDRHLDAAIDSIKNSEGVSLRLIIIDDRKNKNEDLSPILRRLKNYILIDTSGGIGYGLSLELGSTFIESDVVALFNSDDLVSVNRFYNQINSLNKSEVSISNMMRILENGRTSFSKSGEIIVDEYNPLYLLFGSYGANATWCVRSDWWKKNMFFDERECLDWRIALQAFRKSEISFLAEPLYFYRRHDYQTSLDQKALNFSFPNVYKSWKVFSESYGIVEGTKQVFDFLATPWISIKHFNTDELYLWLRNLDEVKQQMSPTTQKQIDYLIARRFLIRILNSEHRLIDKLEFFKKSKSNIYATFLEFTQQTHKYICKI